jgi:L-ascorbate metabolism protein UlaG (beta-lactamase superfamily)
MHVMIIALVLALQVAVPPAPPLQARFIGQMAFSITDGSTTLITDFPYRIGYAGAPPFDDRELQHASPSTLALITHRHLDHFEPTLFAKTSWKLLGPPDEMARIRKDRVVPMTSRVSFGTITIESTRTPHHDLEHYSYIVIWHGKRLYFSGDTESADSLLAAKNLDVAFVSPWQYQAARRTGELIDAEQIVIYHHRPGDQVAGCSSRCVAPRQGDTIEIK